jgi:elongation factor Ts
MLDQIKKLRQETGVSIIECKKALEESNGDLEKARELLRKWGKELAGKRSGREVGAGIIETYIHPDKRVGVMLDLRCETDFVAKSDDFQRLAHELSLQIASMKPDFVNSEDIPKEKLEKEKEIYREQLKDSGKPKEVTKKIIEGKLENYKKESSLMSQTWVKDSKKTIKELMDEYIAKLGENIMVNSFVRYEIS